MMTNPICMYKEMKLEELFKVGSDYELNSWPDSSIG